MSLIRFLKRFLKHLYVKLPFKKQLFTILRLFWSPPHKIYQHLYFNGIFSVPVSKNHSFKIEHFGQQIENELFWKGLDGGWESTSIMLWSKLCSSANVIIDIGANSGLYSLVAKAVSPQSAVYAFEPISRVYKRLVRNNAINRYNIITEESALSNYDGEGIVYDTADSHILSVTVNKNLHADHIPSHPVTISVKRLDTYFKEKDINKLDLLKIDVETHESEVLEGMKLLLDRFKPTLLIEVLNDDVGSRIQAIVAPYGYLYFDIDEGKRITQVQNIKQSSYFNYLLCSEDVAKGLGLIR